MTVELGYGSKFHSFTSKHYVFQKYDNMTVNVSRFEYGSEFN